MGRDYNLGVSSADLSLKNVCDHKRSDSLHSAWVYSPGVRVCAIIGCEVQHGIDPVNRGAGTDLRGRWWVLRLQPLGMGRWQRNRIRHNPGHSADLLLAAQLTALVRLFSN